MFLKYALASKKKKKKNPLLDFYANVKVVQRKHYFVQHRFLNIGYPFQILRLTHMHMHLFLLERKHTGLI